MTGRNLHCIFGKIILAVLLTGIIFLATAPGYAAQTAPVVGTSIGNQATATYTDESGISHSVTSNIVSTIVQQVASLTLTSDNTKYSTVNGQVYFPHTLTNTGNGADTFSLLITQSTTDNFDLSNVQIFADADGNGIPDDPNSPITSTGSVPAGGVFQFVIRGTVPLGATGQSVITVKATSAFDSSKTASNNDTTIVTTNAVISMTKSVSPSKNTSPGPYTYTITYTNTGNVAATNVTISDLIPTGMVYLPGSGRWSVSGATALTDALGGDPTGIAYDFGYTATNKVTAVIDSVASGATGTLSFSVTLASNVQAGIIYDSASYTYYDGATTKTGTTNAAPFTVEKMASLTFTGETVQSASQGATVSFHNTLTNTGNSVDTFDITVNTDTNTFPMGTTFTLYKSDGITLLMDTNGNGIPDTGPVSPGGTYIVVVKATLPSNVWGNKVYTVTKTATSYNDNTKYATATDNLNAIIASTVDLTNNKSISGGATSSDGLGPGPEGSPVTIKWANPAAHVDFDLYVNNTSTVPDVYLLEASTDPTFGSITLPAGWSVMFENETETIITDTGIIAAGGYKHVHCDVYTPTNASAGDYHIYFRVRSTATGAYDIKHDMIQINMIRNISLVANNVGQVYPGGSVVYTHTITNNGNVLEGDGLASSTSLNLTDSQSGFSSAIYWDKNNDGILDATDPIINNLDALIGGTGGASTSAGLYPGESARLFVKVYAPSGALPGTTDVATLTATTTQGTYSVLPPAPVSVTDTSTVVAGNIKIQKLQAIDANSDGTPEYPYDVANITTGAVPGACIRYKTTISNQGTAPATNVVFTDTVPSYTVYHTGDGTTSPTGIACMTFNGTTFTAITAPASGMEGDISANIGTLNPGQTVTVYFGIQIKQ